MALVKCEECGKEISDRAAACIHCGCPIESKAPPKENQDTDNLTKIGNKYFDLSAIIRYFGYGENGGRVDEAKEFVRAAIYSQDSSVLYEADHEIFKAYKAFFESTAPSNDFILTHTGAKVNMTEAIKNHHLNVSNAVDDVRQQLRKQKVKVTKEEAGIFVHAELSRWLDGLDGGINPDRLKFDSTKTPEAASDNAARCPRCGSTSLSGDKKGFGIGKAIVGAALVGGIGLTAGNAGANKVIVTCMKCGHQWQAGK